MQQTADVEILWITVDVAAECLPAYGSFFSSAAVADGDAMATAVAVEMTAACGSSFFSAAVVDSETDSETDAVMDADVETAVATADAAASYETQILFIQTDQRRGKLYPRLFFIGSSEGTSYEKKALRAGDAHSHEDEECHKRSTLSFGRCLTSATGAQQRARRENVPRHILSYVLFLRFSGCFS